MSHRNAATLPTRELHYFPRSSAEPADPAMGMVMLYTDRPAAEYWKALVPRDDEGHSSAEIFDGAMGRGYSPLKAALVHYLGFDRMRLENRDPGNQMQRVHEELDMAGRCR